MKPLILHFAENPCGDDLDVSAVEYSKSLNLSVIKGSNIPAVLANTLSTKTFTKSGGEPDDPDEDFMLSATFVDTSTGTFRGAEASDSDENLEGLKSTIHTQTLTERIEATDNDDDLNRNA